MSDFDDIEQNRKNQYTTFDYVGPDTDTEEQFEDDDPLNQMSTDEAIEAYKNIPHAHFPVWKPAPQRSWVEPFLHLLINGLPVLHNVVQGRPPLGPLPETSTKTIALGMPGQCTPEETFKDVLKFINDANNRECLIAALNKALDELAQSLQKMQRSTLQGGESYHEVLQEGRALSTRLSSTFGEVLSEAQLLEVLTYFNNYISADGTSGTSSMSKEYGCGYGEIHNEAASTAALAGGKLLAAVETGFVSSRRGGEASTSTRGGWMDSLRSVGHGVIEYLMSSSGSEGGSSSWLLPGASAHVLPRDRAYVYSTIPYLDMDKFRGLIMELYMLATFYGDGQKVSPQLDDFEITMMSAIRECRNKLVAQGVIGESHLIHKKINVLTRMNDVQVYIRDISDYNYSMRMLGEVIFGIYEYSLKFAGTESLDDQYDIMLRELGHIHDYIENAKTRPLIKKDGGPVIIKLDTMEEYSSLLYKLYAITNQNNEEKASIMMEEFDRMISLTKIGIRDRLRMPASLDDLELISKKNKILNAIIDISIYIEEIVGYKYSLRQLDRFIYKKYKDSEAYTVRESQGDKYEIMMRDLGEINGYIEKMKTKPLINKVNNPTESDVETSNIFEYAFRGVAYLASKKNRTTGAYNYPIEVRTAIHDLFGKSRACAFPVVIFGYIIKNVFFIPKTIGSTSGVIIDLNNSTNPIINVKSKKDVPLSLFDAMTAKSVRGPDFSPRYLPSLYSGRKNAIALLNKYEKWNVSPNFNEGKHDAMDVVTLRNYLTEIDNSEVYSFTHSVINEELLIIANIGKSVTPFLVNFDRDEYRIKIVWDLNADEFLKAIKNPYSYTAESMAKIISANNGLTKNEAKKVIENAKYYGQWIDFTVDTIISFTPAGGAVNIIKSAADISQTLHSGQTPRIWDVAEFVLSCTPIGKISKKIGKISDIGGKTVKLFLRAGEKIVDVEQLAQAIKIAIDNKDPLHIANVLRGLGFSSYDALVTTKNMWQQLRGEETIAWDKLREKLDKADNKGLTEKESQVHPQSSHVREFKIGDKIILGGWIDGAFVVSYNNGIAWRNGNKLERTTYSLQNAGGWLSKYLLRSEIVIGDYTFRPVKFDNDKYNKMTGIASTYAQKEKSTERLAKLQQDYKIGKEMSNAPQYERYNKLSIDEQLDLFNNDDTDATTRGVIAGKINESLRDINLYNAAKKANDWKASADKATDVVLAPQNIFLKGRPGECLPESILMGWALQSGQDIKLAKKLMAIYSSGNVADNPLYKLLLELHADANASKFNTNRNLYFNFNSLSGAELELLPIESSSVRVDLPQHTMLISKVIKDGKIKYVFYDPNYGLAYFDKYKRMIEFFKTKLGEYDVPEMSIKYIKLDYSRLHDVKINGKDLNEIIGIDDVPQAGPSGMNK